MARSTWKTTSASTSSQKASASPAASKSPPIRTKADAGPAPRESVMSLLEFPIRRYPFTLIVFLCLAVLGWFAFASIAREEDPYFKIPAFFITAIYPGADPKDLERLVAKPIEDRIAELDDVKKIETTVVDGVASINIEFQAYADADKKNDEVTREVNALRPSLPADIAELEIRKWSPGLVN